MKYILIALLVLVSGSAIAHDYGPHRAPIVDIIERYEFRTEYLYGQVCSGWPVDEHGDYYRERRHRGDGRPVADAVIGAIIGSQIGGGNGQVAATAIGAIAGAAIGDRHGRDHYERDYHYDRGGYRRRAGDCRMETYPVRVRYRYYEVVYDHHGYIGTIKTYERPRGRFVYVYE